MNSSLWGEDFEIKEPDTKKIINKIKKPKKVKEMTAEKAIKSKKISIDEKLKIIETNVIRILGVYKNNTLVIKDKPTLVNYIDNAIKNGIIAIDTETNRSLDYLTCKLMGACIYTPGMLQAYIPVNHVNRYTGERLDWQLTENDIKEQFNRLNNLKVVAHNGKFDYQVLHCTTGWDMPLYWDTMIASRILNENEEAGLKKQYITKIDPSIEKYDIEHLFNIDYELVDPDLFALYAAPDPMMTFKLYELQKKIFEEEGHERLYKLFMDVEMPIVKISADMELTGICLDLDYCKRLQLKYHFLLDDLNKKLDEEVAKLKPQIDAWRLTSEANTPQVDKKTGAKTKPKTQQLSEKPLLTSPTQLAILFYDVLKVPVIDKKSPRGTSKEILEKMNLPLAKTLLEFKAFEKLVTSFIDTLPDLLSPKDNRVHAHFNQLGTVTGRFSCTEPNLQQVPAKNKEIRMMFKASDGYMLVGSDFSAQEPRLFANYSMDDSMLDAFKHDRDVYATLGQGVYGCDYWYCMEHHEDGTDNPDGKKRRKAMKGLYLGISYGMGVPSIAAKLGVSIDEAQKIINDFYKSFPKAKKWMDKTHDEVRELGYVEDFWGRRRRLPDVKLPRYTVKYSKFNTDTSFNPLLGSKNKISNDKVLNKYKLLVEDCKSKRDFDTLCANASKDGIYIEDNSGFISQAERQSVNAKVQGGAATMSKKAMINLSKDEELKKYGFKMLICVHDEIIGECKEEYAKECSERLSYIMSNCVPELTVKFKCDPTIEYHWNEQDYNATIKNEYEKLCEKMSKEDAKKYILDTHIESTKDKLLECIGEATC